MADLSCEISFAEKYDFINRTLNNPEVITREPSTVVAANLHCEPQLNSTYYSRDIIFGYVLLKVRKIINEKL